MRALRVGVIFGVLCGIATACSAGSGGSGQNAGGGGPGGGGSAAAGGNAGSLIGVGGSTSGTGGVPLADGGECDAVTQKAENQLAPVDIIFAIDNSGSMTFEAGEVQNNMNTFATAILNQGIDVHVVVISEAGPPGFGSNGVCIPAPLGSGSCPNDSNPPTYFRVDDGVGSSNALDKLIQHYPTYKQYLRQNAVKYFAVVTDDESNKTDQVFLMEVGTLDPGWWDNWKFFGVFCPPGFFCPDLLFGCAGEGAVYQSLVNQTGGLAAELCPASGQSPQQFAMVFSALANSIVTGAELTCEWEIPPPPAGQMFEQNKVNVRYTPGNGSPPLDILFAGSAADCDTNQGWYYDNDAAPTKVIACPATCDLIKKDLSGQIDVLFGCFTQTIPK